jgi:hypothetical protein
VHKWTPGLRLVRMFVIMLTLATSAPQELLETLARTARQLTGWEWLLTTSGGCDSRNVTGITGVAGDEAAAAAVCQVI